MKLLPVLSDALVCPPGYEQDGNGGCTGCDVNMFKGDEGTEPCTACPNNFDTHDQTGSTVCGRWYFFHSANYISIIYSGNWISFTCYVFI